MCSTMLLFSWVVLGTRVIPPPIRFVPSTKANLSPQLVKTRILILLQPARPAERSVSASNGNHVGSKCRSTNYCGGVHEKQIDIVHRFVCDRNSGRGLGPGR